MTERPVNDPAFTAITHGGRGDSRRAPLADALHDLAGRVRRLSPSHRDPEAFHVEKDLIAHELRRIVKEVRR